MTMNQPGAAEQDPGLADQRFPFLVRAVLGSYPPRWRERYGEEFAVLLIDLTADAPWGARIRLVADAIGGGVHARLRLRGGNVMHKSARGPIAATACAVMIFAAALVGLGKMREGPAFGAITHGHATVAVSVDLIRATAVLAVLAVLAGALPLAWTVIRQAVTARLTAATHRNSGPNIAAAVIFTLLGVGVAAICAWAAISIIRRADLTPRLLRAEVIPMAILSLCMTVATAADIGWGLALRAADTALFHSDNGLIATPLAPNWAGSTIVLAVAAAVTTAATVRAPRQLLAPTRI